MLSPWCKKAKIVMIENDISVKELAKRIGMSREYTSAVLNGRSYSESAVKAISDTLNIPDSSCTLTGN
ncbi:MAG: helix-turn-helix domain-containing protein [Lachnospiraceae bacterium]|nr:helix-turn-helix domain-containing protein [Lachnospiraceae bacterium]